LCRVRQFDRCNFVSVLLFLCVIILKTHFENEKIASDFGTCSKELKKDESESSPHLVASTSRLFERNVNFSICYVL
jgi:hypothetical protein